MSDSSTNKIQKFTADGTFVSQWPATSPKALATDPQGSVYSIDQNTGQIQRFSSDGQQMTPLTVTTDPSRYSPLDISINANGDIYVSIQNSGIQKLDSQGKPAGEISFTAESVGNFRTLAGIAIDPSNNAVYALDDADDRVQKFTLDGEFVSQWWTTGLTGQATDIAVDQDGNVYVLGGNVAKFTGDGSLIGSWGSQGDGDCELQGPMALAIDSRNVVYIADSGNYRIQAFSPDGVYLGQWPVGDSGEATGQQV